MYHVQAQVDVTAATRHVSTAHPYTPSRDTDFVIKTVLTEAMSGAAIRPWDIAVQSGRMVTIVGYSAMPPDELGQRLALAQPGLREAVQRILGYEMPAIEVGEQLAFSVRVCPTVRCRDEEGKNHERDAFLRAIEQGREGVSREQVYAEYLGDRLPGADLAGVHMVRFRLMKRSRKNGHGYTTITQPDVVLLGTLTVTDPETLRRAMIQGVGRQRAFGCGMLRLRPMPVEAISRTRDAAATAGTS